MKYRWRLTVDPAEHAALDGLLSGGCGAISVTLPDRALPAITALSFADVPTNHTFYTEISWLGTSGISTGWDGPDGTRVYLPGKPISREAMAAFTYRLAGSPVSTPPIVSPFRDVKPTDGFYREIMWMVSQGITTGYSDGTFRPRNQVTREAMAAFMYRYTNRTSHTTPSWPIFTDVPASHIFYQEITWMAVTGVTTGYATPGGCYTYRPRANVSREAMAAFMYRLAIGGTSGLTEGCKPNLPVVTPGAFCSVAGAQGITSTGKPMVCKTTSTDSRLRWRSA